MGRKKKTDEQIRLAKREAERKRRTRIKADPDRNAIHKVKEKERRQKRKEEKKTKTIADLTPRQQRIQRKEWRERSRKSRSKKKNTDLLLQRLRDNTPPTDSDESKMAILDNPFRAKSTSPSVLGYLDQISLPSPPCASSSTLTIADKVPSPSPSCARNSNSNTYVSRQKLVGMKTARQNKTAKDAIIEQQKKTIETLKKKIHALSMKLIRLNKSSSGKKIVSLSPKQIRYKRSKISIQRFLEQDINSRLCPGKKDTITKRGIKKQKRYLCNTLENLWKKYNNESEKKISYSTFTRLRPFWIVHPKVSVRDTCLCVLHENFGLLTDKLKQLHLIRESNEEVINSSVCSKYNFECMMKQCKMCENKLPSFATFDNSEKIFYKQWITRTETREIKGKLKNIKRTVKDSIETTKKDLIEKFLDMLPKFLSHKFNIWQQYQTITYIKKHLTPNEALLHIDFSENYQCKYASEAQSVHFGASRQQLSLHTCVLHYCHVPGKTQTVSFCSVSENLRHDAAAIYAHLKKSLLELKHHDKNIIIQKLHVLSDGPSTQYKNKTNFYLFSQHLVRDLGIKSATWNFSESGHGKGAADGIGAVVKRTADAMVAQGDDIPDYKTFITKMLCRTNVVLFTVTEKDIIEADLLIPKTLKRIPGTSKIHQITWSCNEPQKLLLTQLSCVDCDLEVICSHFAMAKGTFEYLDTQLSKNAVTSEHFPTTDVLEEMPPPAPTITEFASRVGSWILVQFEGKKHNLHFAGQIVSIENNDSYVVKFLRKKNLDLGTFVWQEPEDVSLVSANDIVCLLPEPTPTRRGNWVEDRIECPKTGTLYFPPKEVYEEMKPESRQPDFRLNKLNSLQGCVVSIIRHDSHEACSNFATTNDLVYNYLPKPLCGPDQRHYKRCKHQYYPQPDLMKCFGNITEWGLRRYKQYEWACTDISDYSASLYEDTFVPPYPQQYLQPNERKPRNSSFTKTFRYKMTKPKKQ